MRWHNARMRDCFGPLCLIGFVGWSLASHLVCGAFHPAIGGVAAGLLAFVGTVTIHRAARRREEARIRAIITTPTEFPAIPVPSYLIPYLSRLSATEVAVG
ncbi:MAG: hypothetical protein M3Y58_04690 [Chloroflexota bacterium]|nr:hypothetical protein [Chloroflexota bacterium]